jgi:hypothetical protein
MSACRSPAARITPAIVGWIDIEFGGAAVLGQRHRAGRRIIEVSEFFLSQRLRGQDVRQQGQ